MRHGGSATPGSGDSDRRGRWPNSDPPALKRPPFLLCVATPHAVVDASSESPGETVGDDRTPPANGLGLLYLKHRRPGGADRGEQLGVLGQTGRGVTPVHPCLNPAGSALMVMVGPEVVAHRRYLTLVAPGCSEPPIANRTRYSLNWSTPQSPLPQGDTPTMFNHRGPARGATAIGDLSANTDGRAISTTDRLCTIQPVGRSPAARKQARRLRGTRFRRCAPGSTRSICHPIALAGRFA